MSAERAFAHEIADLVIARVSEILPMVGAVVEYVDQRTCGFDRATFVRAARSGAFRARKIGRLWFARRIDVNEWMESLPIAAKPKAAAVDAVALDKARRRAGLKPKGR